MDNGTTHVRSFSLLEDVHASLGRFLSRSNDVLQQYQLRYRAKWADLAFRCDAQEAEVERIRESLESLGSDEDNDNERDYLERKLEKAHTYLEHIHQQKDLVNEAYHSFERALEQFDEIAVSQIPRALLFLRKSLDALSAISALQLDRWGGQPLSTSADAQLVIPSSFGQTGFPVDLNQYRLPHGVEWVLLKDVDQNEYSMIRSERDFQHGVSSDTMKHGLSLLQNRILPMMANNPNGATSDFFHSIDRMEGTSAADGLGQVYDVFFRLDLNAHIRVEKARGERLFSITNGKHRIKVAMDLGWRAIPAQVKDLNRSAP